MADRIQLAATLAGLALAMLTTAPARAERKPNVPVPPELEIEVLDPGVDPLGNPAVVVTRDEAGKTRIDIPPAVLVHRYYYTGDRSFQAQMLPGGPSVVIVNHPKTGERCYIPVQMLPGAPRVTYTAHSIEYDYGENAVTVHFGMFGHPTIKYRNGMAWDKKVGNLVHAEQCKEATHKVAAGCKAAASASKTSLKAAAIDGAEVVQTATLPVKNVLRMMPLGAAVFDADLGKKYKEKVAEHERNHEVEHAAKVKECEDLTIRTNR